MINANEASEIANKFHEDQQQKWYEDMKAFADGPLSELIANEAKRGRKCASFNLPPHISLKKLEQYAADNGFKLAHYGGKQYLISWPSQPT